MGARILLISEEAEAGQIWAFCLQREGAEVVLARNAHEVREQWEAKAPDMLIIDMYGGQLDGIGLCRSLRGEASAPILLLIPRADEHSLLASYSAGADECIVKPISPLVFLAKVQAWLRWSYTVPVDLLRPLRNGGLTLDPRLRQVLAPDGRAIPLTSLEFRLLHTFMSHPDQALESNFLISRLWGYNKGDLVMLKNVVYRLRKKLQPHCPPEHFIVTIPGTGYRFSSRSLAGP